MINVETLSLSLSLSLLKKNQSDYIINFDHYLFFLEFFKHFSSFVLFSF